MLENEALYLGVTLPSDAVHQVPVRRGLVPRDGEAEHDKHGPCPQSGNLQLVRKVDVHLQEKKG